MIRWCPVLCVCLLSACGNSGGDARPAASAAPTTMSLQGGGQPGGGLGAVPGGLAGPQGNAGPPVPQGPGPNPAAAQPGGFPGGGQPGAAQPASGGPAGPTGNQPKGTSYSSGK